MEYWKKVLENAMNPWALLGFAGQLIFATRFVVQWISSDKAGRVVLPRVFWYISITGGLITLAYASWKQDPVFMLAQVLGLVIYLRNVVLARRAAPSPGVTAE